MIHINIDRLSPDLSWLANAGKLTVELKQKSSAERSSFIDANRESTWGASSLLSALRQIAGNKCWYSEVPLEGADPNVDHFRPKGDVREVDTQFKNTKKTAPGYWWLAFEYRNYRLTSMHANQRRVDDETAGGKWDYFPIRGQRTPELTEWGAIIEDALALDPCSATDVALLWFDPTGTPCISEWRSRTITPEDEERVRATIWLYHLNKGEINSKRAAFLDDIRKDLLKADGSYKLWKDQKNPSLLAKLSFDQKVAEIRVKIGDNAPFAGAKRCAVRTAAADYPWIDEFHII